MRYILRYRWAGGKENMIVFTSWTEAKAEKDRLLLLRDRSLMYVEVLEGTEVM